MAWPTEWDRGHVLGAIEEASGVTLGVADSLPDTLIAQAQQLGLTPIDLKMWIYDSPQHPWMSQDLDRWARRARLGVYARETAVESEGDSTDDIPRGDDGVQEARR